MNEQKPPRYVGAESLAAAFSVSLRTLAGWKKQGCPCININPEGKKPILRYSVPEVSAWLKTRAKGKGEQA